MLRTVVAGGLALALAACSADDPAPAPAAPVSDPAAPPSALRATAVRVPAGTDAEPFDQARQMQAPPGWTVSVWARVPSARLLAWTPGGRLLVSRPKSGDVVELLPSQGDIPPAQRTLVDGLNQPHGLAFAGDTLYVAESDQVVSFTYRDGVLSDKRVVVAGLPDEKSPDLRGAYAHALKSVAVGRGGEFYISVG